MCCVVGLVVWYFFSMFQFYNGWIRLDPLCRTISNNANSIRVVDDRYTREAAERVKNAIAHEYSEDGVFVDDEGTVFIRPAIVYGEVDFVDRFGQWALKSDDEPYFYNGPGVTCDELQPLVRSPIDVSATKRLGLPYSFYVSMHFNDTATWNSWRDLYRQ
jgi:hypothetical protein